MKRLPFILALVACQMHAQTPCDVFDHNRDGNLGANTWLYVLGSCGAEGGEPDVDGAVTVSDELALLGLLGG